MRLLVYSALRLVVLAAALGLGYVVGLRSWLLVAVAAVIAALASYLLLRSPRDAAAAQLVERAARRRTPSGQEEDAAFEDAADDRSRRLAAGGTPSEGEGEAEQHAVGQLDEAGVAQDDDEVPAARAAQDQPGQPQDRDR